jgi:hypothetical protein
VLSLLIGFTTNIIESFYQRTYFHAKNYSKRNNKRKYSDPPPLPTKELRSQNRRTVTFDEKNIITTTTTTTTTKSTSITEMSQPQYMQPPPQAYGQPQPGYGQQPVYYQQPPQPVYAQAPAEPPKERGFFAGMLVVANCNILSREALKIPMPLA